jgi:polyisoprenoid-binding protein YceI
MQIVTRYNSPVSHFTSKLLLSALGLITLAQVACASAVTETAQASLQQGSAPVDTPAAEPASAPSGSLTLEVTQATEARYIVREQLADLNFPSDAVGITDAVQGSIVLTSDGKVAADESRIVVDLRQLKSDRDMRDNYIRQMVLQTSRYPNAEFVVKRIDGLPWPRPTSGEVTLQIIGDLTIARRNTRDDVDRYRRYCPR